MMNLKENMKLFSLKWDIIKNNIYWGAFAVKEIKKDPFDDDDDWDDDDDDRDDEEYEEDWDEQTTYTRDDDDDE